MEDHMIGAYDTNGSQLKCSNPAPAEARTTRRAGSLTLRSAPHSKERPNFRHQRNARFIASSLEFTLRMPSSRSGCVRIGECSSEPSSNAIGILSRIRTTKETTSSIFTSTGQRNYRASARSRRTSEEGHDSI